MTEFVDVGGYRVAAYVRGEQSTAVVFVSWLGDGGDYWQPVLDRLDLEQKTITYDRAGLGASDSRPADDRFVSYCGFAQELHALLAGLGVIKPVVLVGHSLGGSIIRAFTMQWPELVAGLVLVDVSLVERSDYERVTIDGGRDTATRFDLRRGAEELRAESFPDIPVVVLSRGAGDYLPGGPRHSELSESTVCTPEFEALWQQTHRELALKARATQVIANGIGHRFPDRCPALVALSIEAVLRAAQTGSTLELDQAAVSAVGSENVVIPPDTLTETSLNS